MNDGLIVLSIIVGLVLVYFLLMFFLPEWVGISGKKTREIQKDHHPGDSDDSAPKP